MNLTSLMSQKDLSALWDKILSPIESHSFWGGKMLDDGIMLGRVNDDFMNSVEAKPLQFEIFNTRKAA